DFAFGGGLFPGGGFGDWFRGDDHFDFELWDPSPGCRGAFAGVYGFGGAYGLGGWVMDLGAECFVPGCGFDYSVFGAVLDAGFAGGVSAFLGACAVAMVVWVESDGWGD